MKYDTKDSGARVKFSTGMVRDTNKGKARFDLIFPKGVPYNQQLLTRFAELMARGADKYTERNWEKASTTEELDRAQESALRHMIQWYNGEDDEDHAAAVMFNLMAAEYIKLRAQEEKHFEDMKDESHHCELTCIPRNVTSKECDATFNDKKCILPALHRDEQHLYTVTGALHG